MEREKNRIEPGHLYLVATPIGNLADLSERAVKALSEVDFIAAEDTRNTAHLLAYLGVKKPMVSYFEHNKRERGELICDRIEAGESCALVTDAGTPAISDPGEDIVKLCAERKIPVTGVPGPCAAVSALILSGLTAGRFVFEGFLPVGKSERRARFDEVRSEKRTLIFYEAPHKLKGTLDDMAKQFGGERRVSLCRELTKLNEEVMRTTFAEAIEYYKSNDPRGEYVLIVEGASEQKNPLSELDVSEHVAYYESTGMTHMEALKAAARDRGVSKSEVYSELLKRGK